MSQYNTKGMASDLCLGRPSSSITDSEAANSNYIFGHPVFSACNNSNNIQAAGENGFANEIAGLECYVRALQGERHKIDYFRRELPICMGLLDDAIEASRMRLTKAVASSRSVACQASYSNYMNPVYVKGSVHNNTSTSEEAGHHMQWTSSKCKPHENDDFKQQPLKEASNMMGDDTNTMFINADPQYCKARPSRLQLSSYDPSHDNPNINYFNKLQQQKEATLFKQCNEQLELMKQAIKGEGVNTHEYSSSNNNEEDEHAMNVGRGGNQYGGLIEEHAYEEGVSPTGMISNVQHNSMSMSAGGQTPRKPRRCWSPELHQRFLHALQHLGGPQLATPKQIREVMHVEGLTNDEVKSHLQKFRLHTRRPAPLHASEPAQQPHHLVLFGGIWVPTSPAESAPAAQLAACQLANSGHAMSPGNHNPYMQFQHVIGQNPMQTLMSAASSDQMDVHAGMETASEVDVARSDQSTSQNGEAGGADNTLHEEEDTEIHLGSKPIISREITSPIAKARYQQ